MDNKYLDLVALILAYVPEADWENGDKREKAIEFLNDNIFSVLDLTLEEQEEIINYVYGC